MQINDVAVQYEHVIEALVAADRKDLARALVDMGVPYRLVISDPYFAKHYGKWVHNARVNHAPIFARSKRRELDIATLPISEKPAIVCGSGYSINNALPYLLEWQGDIIAGNSNVFTLIAHGITPTYLVVLDSHPRVAELLTSYKRWPPKVRLITHPTINPALVAGWKGPASFYHVTRQKFELFDLVFPAMYHDTGIRTGLTWRICVVNNEVQIAGALGAPGRPIFLTGCDFGWKDRARHRCMTFEPSIDGKDLIEKKVAPIPDDDAVAARDYAVAKDENGWEYTGDMIILRDELYKTWWANRLALIDCSGGSLIGLPTARIEDVVASQGAGFEGVYDKRKEYAKVIADYLNSRVAVKQEQYRKLREGRDAKAGVGDTGDGGGAVALVGGGGRDGSGGEAGPGSGHGGLAVQDQPPGDGEAPPGGVLLPGLDRGEVQVADGS